MPQLGPDIDDEVVSPITGASDEYSKPNSHARGGINTQSASTMYSDTVTDMPVDSDVAYANMAGGGLYRLFAYACMVC